MPFTFDTIIAEVDIWAIPDTSACNPCDDCEGDVKVDVGFKWRGLSNDPVNTMPGGVICNGKRCVDLTTNANPPGKEGARQVSIPCKGGVASGRIHVIRRGNMDWDEMQQFIERMMDVTGQTWDQIFRQVRRQSAVFVVNYNVSIAKCGVVQMESVSLSIPIQGRRYWTDPRSRRIRLKR